MFSVWGGTLTSVAARGRRGPIQPVSGAASDGGTAISFAYTPKVWYDMSDLSTLLDANGLPVAQVNGTAVMKILDLSGNDFHLVNNDDSATGNQNTLQFQTWRDVRVPIVACGWSAYGATAGTAQNCGFRTVAGDAGTPRFDTTKGVTIFAVVRCAGTDGGANTALISKSAGNASAHPSGFSVFGNRRVFGNGTTSSAYATASQNLGASVHADPKLLTIVYDYAGNVVREWLLSAETLVEQSISASLRSTANFADPGGATSVLMLGNRNTELSQLDFGEVMVFNAVLPNTQREAVEAYLNTKWRLGMPADAPNSFASRFVVLGASAPRTIFRNLKWYGNRALNGLAPTFWADFSDLNLLVKKTTPNFTRMPDYAWPAGVTSTPIYYVCDKSGNNYRTITREVRRNTTAYPYTTYPEDNHIVKPSVAGGGGPLRAVLRTGFSKSTFCGMYVENFITPDAGLNKKEVITLCLTFRNYAANESTRLTLFGMYIAQPLALLGANRRFSNTNNNETNIFPYTDISTPSDRLRILICEFNFSANTYTEYLNGSRVGGENLPTTPYALRPNWTRRFGIAALGNEDFGTNYCNAEVAEVMLFVRATALSTAERQAIEGSLATKWGISDLLPAAHPFRSTAAFEANRNIVY